MGPKSKFCFLAILRNVPQLVSNHIWAFQHHFCKSLSDFKTLAKFLRNRHFCEKAPRKRPKIFFSPILHFFYKIYLYLVRFSQFRTPKVNLAQKYSPLLFTLDPPNLAYFRGKNPKNGRYLQFLNSCHFAKKENFSIP